MFPPIQRYLQLQLVCRPISQERSYLRCSRIKVMANFGSLTIECYHKFKTRPNHLEVCLDDPSPYHYLLSFEKIRIVEIQDYHKDLL